MAESLRIFRKEFISLHNCLNDQAHNFLIHFYKKDCYDAKNEDDLKNEDSLKNENNIENEDNLKNEDALKKKDDLKNEDDLKTEDSLILKTVSGPTLHNISCACSS